KDIEVKRDGYALCASLQWVHSLAKASLHRGLKITENVIAIYDLKQDFSAPGPIHSGRETVYRNGSLLLRNVTMKDTGRYTLRTINRHGDIVSTTIMNLHVHKHVMQPFLEISDATVAVEKSVSLICISPHDDNSFHWLFNNQSLQLTDRMTLTVTKRVLRIDPVRIEDAGDYQCEVSNPVSSKTSLPVRLAVVKG
ncbi:carcinoembryonic antigen-related cell adhesion molecule 3-like protein, partial [Cricetulus griseus]